MPQPAAIGRRAEQESPAVAVHVDSWVRRGRDYLQVLIVATAGAADVAEALDLAWRAFRKAAGSDAAGWDDDGRADERGQGVPGVFGEALA